MQKILRLRERPHERAQRLGEVNAPLLVLLEFAEDGAAHAQRGILDAGEQLLPPADVLEDGARHFAAFFPREHAEDVRIQPPDALPGIGHKARRIEIGEVCGSLPLPREPALQVDPLPLQHAEVIVREGGGAHALQLEHLRKFVDKGIEAVRGRDDEDVPGAQALVVVHEIAQAVQHDHRLAAARAPLQDKALPLGAGDDVELLLLDGADDVAHFDVVLAAADDVAQVGIEQDLLVPAADLLGRQNVAHAQVFVAEVEEFSVPDGEGAPEDGAVGVFVDGEGDAALLIIADGERRTPVDDLEIDVPLLADIVAVVPLGVHHVHAREVGFREEGTVFLDLLLQGGDLLVLFADGAVILRPVPLPRADGGDLLLRLGDAPAVTQEIGELEHPQDRRKMFFFIRPLRGRVEQGEIPRLIGVLFGIEQFFQRSELIHIPFPPLRFDTSSYHILRRLCTPFEKFPEKNL